MSKGFSVFTFFKAKDGVSPVFKNMTKGAGGFGDKIKSTTNNLKGLGSCVQNTCNKINTAFNAAIGFIAVDTIKDKIFSFVDSASNLQETLGKTGEVFKTNSSEVENWAKTSVKSMGLAEQTALDTASLFGDMGTGMGMTTKRAAEMSMNLTQLSADLASFKNVEQSLAANALKGVFTGETEALKNMGVVMTESVLQEYARANGIRKKLKDMTQAEKIELRYQYVMKATTNAQGDFNRTFGNYANQKRVGEELKKQFEINFGKIMLPTFNKAMVKFNSFATDNLDKVTKAFEKMFDFIMSIIKTFTPVWDAFKESFAYLGEHLIPELTGQAPLIKNLFENVFVPGLTLAIQAITDLFKIIDNTYNFIKDYWVPIISVLAGVGGMLALKSAFDAVSGAIAWFNTSIMIAGANGITVVSGFNKLKFVLGTYTQALWKSVAAIWAQTTALLANPWTWVAIVIAGVVAGAILIWKNWDKITAVMGEWWNNIQEWLTGFWTKCTEVFAAVSAVVQDWLTGFWNKAVGVFTKIGETIKGWISGFWDTVKLIFGVVGNFIKESFINVLLMALSPIGLIIKGLISIGEKLGFIKGQAADVKLDTNVNANNDAAIRANYNSPGGGANTIFGNLNVGVKIDNSTAFPATSSLNLTGAHNLNLVPAN